MEDRRSLMAVIQNPKRALPTLCASLAGGLWLSEVEGAKVQNRKSKIQNLKSKGVWYG
jgi:hypothetical protein